MTHALGADAPAVQLSPRAKLEILVGIATAIVAAVLVVFVPEAPMRETFEVIELEPA